MQVNSETFEDLRMPEHWVQELQEAWQLLLKKMKGRQAIGETIYDNAMEAAPVLRSDILMPRPVWASRFTDGWANLVSICGNAKLLSIKADTMAFQHVVIPVSLAKCDIFRDAIALVFESELGPRFTSEAKSGLVVLANYIAGSLLYVQRVYSGRVKSVQKSWKKATKHKKGAKEAKSLKEAEQLKADSKELEETVEEKNEVEGAPKAANAHAHPDAEGTETNNSKAAKLSKEEDRSLTEAKKRRAGTSVPKTFNEMFLFNSCVMGFETSEWMDLILDQLDAIASNVGSTSRLQEECDVLALVLSKYKGPIKMPEFKAVLLATLRSSVKDWDMETEMAWTWFWDRIQGMLMDLKTPPQYEKVLRNFLANLQEDNLNILRTSLFSKFFTAVPAGQDYLKTSATRMNFIADRIVEMTLEMYERPRKMAEELSGLGLLHVGMSVPQELFPPFVQAAQEAVEDLVDHDVLLQSFRWSLSLTSRIMARVIFEGSTVIMKAICVNDELALRKAMSVAARSERNAQLLTVSVGTRSISPLYWSIDSGSLECAKSILEDILTIRADRDVYYYGCDALFERHPEVIQHLCNYAPNLLWTLLDGLIWRSRITHSGQRRVNYFVKNLIQDRDGNFSHNISWLVNYRNAKVISHPAVVLAADTVWFNLAVHQFLKGRIFFLFTLCVFVTGQSILVHHDGSESDVENVIVACCRGFTYMVAMLAFVCQQMSKLYIAFVTCDFQRFIIPVPRYLCNGKELAHLLLTWSLVVMMSLEPILWCLKDTVEGFVPAHVVTTNCGSAEDLRNTYSVCSCFAILMFWVLLMDLSVFSMKVYAFFLVCGRIITEVALFLLAASFLVIAFATSINAVNHHLAQLDNLGECMRLLGQAVLKMVPASFYENFDEEPVIMLLIALFLSCITFLLLNLLVVQIIESYNNQYENLEGLARLSRGEILVQMNKQVGSSTWADFLTSLRFNERLEFNEGDIGLAGGVQVLENANVTTVTTDRILRFGGSTQPSLPWPEEIQVVEDRFQQLENLIIKAMKKDQQQTRTATRKKSLLGMDASNIQSAAVESDNSSE
ncbi:unnamed protein product [Effrenium voratum]|nr:unnamed protein product [Effrenium voratum]